MPGLAVFCVSPGWCRTQLGRSARIPCYVYPALLLVLAVFSHSAEEGADSILFCAAERREVMDTMRGKFIRGRKVEETIEQILDRYDTSRGTLWEVSEQLINNVMKK